MVNTVNAQGGHRTLSGRGGRRHAGVAGWRRAAAVPVLAIVPLLGLLQGCDPNKAAAGSSGSATSSASAGSQTQSTGGSYAATPQSTATDSASLGRDAEAFTTCVREHGVSDFPGVTVSSGGTLQLNSSSSFNPLSSAYKAAAKACASTLPAGTSLPSDPVAPSIAGPSLNLG